MDNAYTIHAINGNCVIRVTLYGPVSRERHDAETRVAQHRAEQLATPPRPWRVPEHRIPDRSEFER